MNAITDASASNPYLIKVMPGIYDIGASEIRMKAFVDIEGSGEKVTVIKGTQRVIGNYEASSEIRHITLEAHAEGTGGDAAALHNSSNISVAHVTLIASGGSVYSLGLWNSSPGKPVLTDVTIIVSGGYHAMGVYANNAGSVVTINNSTIQVTAPTNYSRGVAADMGAALILNNSKVTISTGIRALYGFNSGPITVRNSEVYGSIDSNSLAVYVANTLLDGPVSGAGATCIGTYDPNFNPVSCP